MKKFILLISSLVLITTTTLCTQKTKNHTNLKNKIDQYLTDGIPNGFSGSILIVKEDQIILNKGYGMADRENNISYTPNTVATIGSVTKQFTATAILKLEEMNKLKVTDLLSTFFKNIPEDKKDITIHQLLTHSAGLVDAIGEGDFDEISRKAFFEKLFASKLIHQPGTKYSYSNAGYTLLARIIELVSGQDYERFLNEYLFQPADMNQTGYFLPQWKENQIAKGYAYSCISVGSMISRYQKMGEITWTLKGNGGIHSTPEDMYKWYIALKENKILSASMFQKLTTPYLLESEGGTTQYAYGWVIYNSNRDTKIISHNGGNRIFFHDFIWSPEEEVLIIFFTNGNSKEVEVAWSIEKMIFEKNYHPKPIKKNLHLLVFDFMKNNKLQESNELISTIKKEYTSSIKKPATLNGLGYDLLRHDTPNNIDWAVVVFKLNTELFPKDGNTWDSLGESYLLNGQKDLALDSYKKALNLAPSANCSWCQSSTNAIKEIRKMQ